MGTKDFEIGKDRTVSANTERMLPDRLHSLIYAYINMRKSGLTGQKMFLTRFNKIFWNENVCVLSACLSEKQIQLYLITGEVCATLITNQGHWAALGLFVRKCMRTTEGLKREEGRNTLQYIDDLLICAQDEVTCVADTVALLNHLAREGHKVSPTKLQFVKQGKNFFWVTL